MNTKLKCLLCQARIKIKSTFDNISVDGYWTDWNAWSTCTATCGGGTRYRERTCIEPQYGGDYCLGDATETEACDSVFCPGLLSSSKDSLVCNSLNL